jgi:hypothetical protein
MDKVKASDKLSFPLTLDLPTLITAASAVAAAAAAGTAGQQRLDHDRQEVTGGVGDRAAAAAGAQPSSGCPCTGPGYNSAQPLAVSYELAAVLIHKGHAASHGHYGTVRCGTVCYGTVRYGTACYVSVRCNALARHCSCSQSAAMVVHFVR